MLYPPFSKILTFISFGKKSYCRLPYRLVPKFDVSMHAGAPRNNVNKNKLKIAKKSAYFQVERVCETRVVSTLKMMIELYYTCFMSETERENPNHDCAL